jgi:hypothetical protein
VFRDAPASAGRRKYLFQVDVVLKIRRDQVRNAVRNILAIKPAVKVIGRTSRLGKQGGQRRQPPPGDLQSPVTVKHGE